jgi:hypothetical protein
VHAGIGSCTHTQHTQNGNKEAAPSIEIPRRDGTQDCNEPVYDAQIIEALDLGSSIVRSIIRAFRQAVSALGSICAADFVRFKAKIGPLRALEGPFMMRKL